MKAAVIYGSRDVRLETVETPSIQKDEILVKVKVCGICGTDLHRYRTGDVSPSGKLILGHEFSGEIVEVGKAVNGLRVGDRVVGIGYRACGKCHWCHQGQTERCPNPAVPGEGLDGAFAEYVVVPNPMPGKMLFQIPEDLSWEVAATIEPVSVACFAVRRAGIQPKDTVVVLGAGMIGQCIAQGCKAVGAARVIVSEPSAMRRDIASKLGADTVLNPVEIEPIEAVKEATSGEMADVVFECSGSPAAFRQGAQMLRPFGRMMQVGIFEKNLELTPPLMSLMFQFRNMTLRGCGGQRWDMALEMVQAGQIKTRDLITHQFPLDRSKEAFETQLNADEAIKVLLKP
jgi:2-desacetyl-2-hydroxyethyl bacteriochlorophyllide A dehydrogenase